ncbi:MAG TPA: putative peptidoglycan glycosyltransferase FtsW, partial [Rhodocyclaceae bacterium]|nr:putative peptidoglycan glycosyltransferase FtsW [Rhodocyclaceae bacterium]
MLINAIDAPRRQVAEVDHLLLWSALALLLFGLVMVYSASIAMAEGSRFTNHQPGYFLMRHGVFLGIGLIAAAAAFQLPLSFWQKYAPHLFVIGVVLLALVLIPGIGRDVNGARRWLPLGIANLQPSELMKLFVVLYAADYTVRKMPVMHDLKQAFVPMAVAMVFVGGLLLKEPDFGAFVVIISIAIGILFLGGLRARLFAILFVVLLAAFAFLIVVSPYRRDRIFGFMDPWGDAFGRGYQLSHSLIAFGRGEIFGVGLGASVEKLFYLPEAHTDFLLAVIAEELGFVGVMVVVLLFALIVQRAFAIGRQCVS